MCYWCLLKKIILNFFSIFFFLNWSHNIYKYNYIPELFHLWFFFQLFYVFFIFFPIFSQGSPVSYIFNHMEVHFKKLWKSRDNFLLGNWWKFSKKQENSATSRLPNFDSQMLYFKHFPIHCIIQCPCISWIGNIFEWWRKSTGCAIIVRMFSNVKCTNIGIIYLDYGKCPFHWIGQRLTTNN